MQSIYLKPEPLVIIPEKYGRYLLRIYINYTDIAQTTILILTAYNLI